MKKLVTIVLLFSFSFSSAQIKKEKEFKNTVNNIISAYNKKDFLLFNKFIHKKNGVYLLVKNGVYTYWYNRGTIFFNDTISSNKLPVPYNTILCEQKLANNFKITYTSYPILNCNTKNLKTGLFVDTAYKVNVLSNLIKKYINYNDIGLDKKDLKNELKTINKIEEKSRKILILGNASSKWGDIFIFYLTYINNKWFISIIDFATFDCSA